MLEAGLLRWPVDVLLYMLSFCNLEDGLSFSMICKDIHTLTAHKAFWITALQNERRIKPIACLYHEDITMHDIHNLRRIALHTRRLERNWDSAKPQVLGQIKVVSLGFSTLDILFQVPGTELYVLHCHTRGTVELWHVGLGIIVGGPFRISPKICDISQGEDLPGKFTMALLVRKEDSGTPYQIVLICVEYGLSDFTLTVPLLLDLPATLSRFYWAIFLDDDIVGVLCYNNDALKLCVYAVNRTTGNDSFIVTDLPNAETSLDEVQLFESGTTVVDGNLCILIADSWIFTVPNSHLPRDNNPECSPMSIFRFEDRFNRFNHQPRTNDEDSSFFTILTVNSPYGVSAMSVNVVSTTTDPTMPNALDITFWMRPELTGEDKPLLVPHKSESVAGLFHSTYDEGSPSRWENLVQTLSGRRALMLLNVREEADGNSPGALVIRLISCESDRTRSTYRDLVLPDHIDLSNVHGLFLDDHLGVVSLIDSQGMLYAIPYA